MGHIAVVIALAVLPGPRHCEKLFTVAMGERAARSVYAGTKHVSRRELAMLKRIERCQRNPHAQDYVRWYVHRQRTRWQERRLVHGPAVASWYDDSGATACGFHATYGFASLFLPCGAAITLYHNGHSVRAVMQDHGPYIGGRLFDLNPGLKAALGCSDLCSVYWR